MGKLWLRNLKARETKWSDKEAKRHEHNFNIESIALVKRVGSGIDRYHVMKCEHCNSFHVILDKEGSWRGDASKNNLPFMYFISTRKSLDLDKNMKCVSSAEFHSAKG